MKLDRPKIQCDRTEGRKQLAKGVGILKLPKSLGIGTGTVQRMVEGKDCKKADARNGAKNSSCVIRHRYAKPLKIVLHCNNRNNAL